MSHDHSHHAPPQPDLESTPIGYYERLEAAFRELMIEKGLVTAAEIREQIERIDARNPALGGRVVTRAWTDPAFRERLIADGSAAVAELGIAFPEDVRLLVVENTPRVHNLVVCTLCSCYPSALLGLPPDWYKSRAYRSRAVRDPRDLLREFGTVIPGEVELRVHDSTATMRYLVLPLRPAGTDELSEEDLARLVTRDSMVGVAVVRALGTAGT